mgnify:CR=1 FL=1
MRKLKAFIQSLTRGGAILLGSALTLVMAKEDAATLFHYHEDDQLTVVTRDSSGYDQRQGSEP